MSEKKLEKTGILCATDTELEPFLASIPIARTMEKAMLKFYEGHVPVGKTAASLPVNQEFSVVMGYCGVCKVNAAIAAQILIDTFGVDALVSAGTAGGMDESVQLFDTVVSERSAYHDVDEDVLTEFHPWMSSIYFEAEERLLKAAKEYSQNSQHPMRFGRTVTGEQFIEDDKRSEINRKFAPLSVDMETAAIAHVCFVNRIPFISIRTITDTASHAGMAEFERNCETASRISADVVIGVLEKLAND